MNPVVLQKSHPISHYSMKFTHLGRRELAMLKNNIICSFKTYVIVLGLVVRCESIKAGAEELYMLSGFAAVILSSVARASLD